MQKISTRLTIALPARVPISRTASRASRSAAPGPQARQRRCPAASGWRVSSWITTERRASPANPLSSAGRGAAVQAPDPALAGGQQRPVLGAQAQVGGVVRCRCVGDARRTSRPRPSDRRRVPGSSARFSSCHSAWRYWLTHSAFSGARNVRAAARSPPRTAPASARASAAVASPAASRSSARLGPASVQVVQDSRVDPRVEQGLRGGLQPAGQRDQAARAPTGPARRCRGPQNACSVGSLGEPQGQCGLLGEEQCGAQHARRRRGRGASRPGQCCLRCRQAAAAAAGSGASEARPASPKLASRSGRSSSLAALSSSPSTSPPARSHSRMSQPSRSRAQARVSILPAPVLFVAGGACWGQ